MKTRLLSIGRFKKSVEAELFQHYRDRCPWPIELVEISLRGSPADPLRTEAERLTAHLEKGPVIALDETGELLTSRQLAARIGAWRDQGHRRQNVLIGGADGLQAELVARADLVLALGRMTWPHLLVRGLIAEQLYRASMILTGHPYHRG